MPDPAGHREVAGEVNSVGGRLVGVGVVKVVRVRAAGQIEISECVPRASRVTTIRPISLTGI